MASVASITMVGLWMACPFLAGCGESQDRAAATRPALAAGAIVRLPAPDTVGQMALETALSSRRTTRDLSGEGPTIAELGQILWAAQGVTDALGHRTAPSAGSSYPLRLYLAVGDIPGLAAGVYRYVAGEHALEQRSDEDCRSRVGAAVGQAWVASAPAMLTVCADFTATRAKYGEKGVYHVYVEAGAAVQNIYLQCAARGLGTGFAGGFDDARLRLALSIGEGETPVGVMPIGRAR